MKLTLLFIHGAAGSHKVWEHQMKFFSHALAIDLQDHGIGIGKRTIDGYVREVRKLCDERDLKNVVMVGHSMGGAIAQKFALDNPEYLKAIVLVGTGAKLRVNPMIFNAIRRGYAQAIEFITRLALSNEASGEIKKKVAQEMMDISPESAYDDFEACDKFDTMNRLKEIKVPTLIICGLEDQLTPVKYSEYLRNNITNSKLELIASAGHMVMLEKPEEFNEKLEKFIKELDNC